MRELHIIGHKLFAATCCTVLAMLWPDETNSASSGSDDRTQKVGEPSVAVSWSPTLEEAMARGQAENKPVLIAFSARRQEHRSDVEF